jgi:hypothetical protein
VYHRRSLSAIGEVCVPDPGTVVFADILKWQYLRRQHRNRLIDVVRYPELNVYLKQRSKYRFVDGVSVLYNHSTLFGQSEQGIARFRAFSSRQAVQSGFFQAFARLPVFSVSALLVDGSSH